MNVDEDDNSISIELAVETEVRFGINKSDAQDYAKEILNVVRESWISLATKYGLSRRQIEEMRPAVSICFKT